VAEQLGTAEAKIYRAKYRVQRLLKAVVEPSE